MVKNKKSTLFQKQRQSLITRNDLNKKAWLKRVSFEELVLKIKC